MRLVVALGGNALLERGEQPDATIQSQRVMAAAKLVAELVVEHEVVLTHGNGPQVGLLALESASDQSLSRPYPFDVLDAETQGMIGYWLLQGMANALPGHQVVSLICRTEVDVDDPAFTQPSKFVGPVYHQNEAQQLSERWHWSIAQDGQWWRRVVPSPEPQSILELPTIEMLLTAGSVVICSGGGGIPVVRLADGRTEGTEAVIDKDLTAALLAQELKADMLLLLTDVPAVEADYGTPSARPLGRVTAGQLRSLQFPAGSMGPKVDAACRFVEATGRLAVIGRLGDAARLVDGGVGTVVTADPAS